MQIITKHSEFLWRQFLKDKNLKKFGRYLSSVFYDFERYVKVSKYLDRNDILRKQKSDQINEEFYKEKDEFLENLFIQVEKEKYIKSVKK
jgi:hypothetical protein